MTGAGGAQGYLLRDLRVLAPGPIFGQFYYAAAANQRRSLLPTSSHQKQNTPITNFMLENMLHFI